jgi:hypothetical protein
MTSGGDEVLHHYRFGTGGYEVLKNKKAHDPTHQRRHPTLPVGIPPPPCCPTPATIPPV